MKKLILLFSVIAIFLLVRPAFAQMGTMMGDYQNQPTPSQSDLTDEQNMQDAGLKIWQNLQSGKISCSNLTSSDYEKLGEYFMGQAAGSTENHVYWDNNIEQMMGDQGDTNMHIAWGQRGSGCFANVSIPSNAPSSITGMMNNYFSNQRGGVNNMMWGYGGNFANFGGFSVLGVVTWLVVIVDLILLGIFLWKRINK